MRKHCSNVCKLRPCLATESTNLARMRTIVTAALQQQYSQMELIFWIILVYKIGTNCNTADPPHSWVCTLQFSLFMEKLWWQHLCTVVWSPHSFIFTLVIQLCDKYKNLAFKVLHAHDNAQQHLKCCPSKETHQVSVKEYHIVLAVIHVWNHCNIQELKHLPLNS